MKSHRMESAQYRRAVDSSQTANVIGKRTLVEHVYGAHQVASARPSAPAPPNSDDSPQHAAVGLKPLATYPHASTIFGLMGVAVPGRAVVDPHACRSANVEAFTIGDTTHFATAEPSLRVAAHEAAHQVQHAGLTRDAGMGPEGHADAVATAVASGRSAVALLGSDGAVVDPGFHAYTEFSVTEQRSGHAAGWKDPYAHELKVSDDGRLALSNPGYGQAKMAWGEPAEIEKAAATLKEQGSMITIAATAPSISGRHPTTAGGAMRTLARIEVRDAEGGVSTGLGDD